MPSTKVKGKTRLKVTTKPKNNEEKPSQAVKPKLGRGIGGILMTSIRLKVEKDKNKEAKHQKKQSNNG